jgi:hypothetical protein
MALTLQTKQPAESRLYNFDFSGLMQATETIASVGSTVATPSGLTVGTSAISGQIVQVRLSGGTAATEYLVTCTILTSASSTLELEGRLWVENIATLTADEQMALDQVVILVQANNDPVLDYSTNKSELRIILANSKRASIWTISTSYEIGSVVMPTTRNGRRYRLIAFDGSGTSSGTTEPNWPAPNAEGNDAPVWANIQLSPVVGWWRNAIVTDGNITWQEDGEDYDSLWDIRRAVFNGWMLKASKAVCAIDLASGQKKLSASQVYDHCISQAQRYAPVYVL